MIDLVFPATEPGRLLWSQAVLVWMLANYAFPRGPYGRAEAQDLSPNRIRSLRLPVVSRAVGAGLLVSVLPGLHVADLPIRALLALVTAVTLVALPLLRLPLADREDWGWALPSLELLGVATAGVLLGIIVALGDLGISSTLIDLPFSTRELRGATVVAAALVFLTGGATHVVRGILDAVRAKPRDNGATIDVPEYNRGRVIGNLERVLLLAFALTGAYEAMAIVIAAKGLVRWTDLKDREFAEYFLIGSLTSLLLALGASLLVNALR